MEKNEKPKPLIEYHPPPDNSERYISLGHTTPLTLFSPTNLALTNKPSIPNSRLVWLAPLRTYFFLDHPVGFGWMLGR